MSRTTRKRDMGIICADKAVLPRMTDANDRDGTPYARGDKGKL